MTQLIDLGKIRFYFAGTWDSSAQYELNDVVKYGGNVYVYTYALASIGHVPTETNYWALMIEGINFTGVYSPTTEYQVGDGIAYGGKVYISIKTGSGQTPPNAQYWSQFADGIQYEGAWSSTSNYQKNDVVTYGGSVFIAKQDTTNHNPVTSPSYWDEFVSGIDATGVWNASTNYAPNQLVAYGSSIYQSLTNNLNKVPTQNLSDWVPFVNGISAKGTYSPTVQYHLNDIVIYGSTVYISKGDTLGNAPSDTTYWSVLTSGTLYRGSWTPSVEYRAGDVVQWGGNTYITDQFHSSGATFAGDTAYWEKYNSGIRYRGAWVAGAYYVEGDVVSDGENARIAVQDHQSGAFLIDDELKWNILAKGASGLLPAQGGRQGYVLTTDGSEASFERDVTNLYFGDGARTFIEGDAALTDVATAAAWDTTGFAQNITINNLDLSLNNGTEQSADFIAYTTGSTNDAGWADMGFTGPEFDSTTYGITGPSDAYVFGTAAPGIEKTITNKVLTDNVATITTSTDHGYAVGKIVEVTGVDATFNGKHTITAVTSNTFSFAKTASDVTSASATGNAKQFIGAGNLVLATGDTGSENRIVLAAGGFASGKEQVIIIPDTMVHIEIETNSTSATNGALVVAGGAGITGDVNIAGDLSVLGNVDLQGVTKLPVGAGATNFETTASLSDAVVIAAGTSASFVQNALVNLGTGISSSADYIAYAKEGNNVSGWIDMGITNLSFNDPTYGVTGEHDGYIFMSAPAGTTGDGNLVIATDNTGAQNKIVFAAGGLGTGNEQMVITPNQNVHIEIATPSTSASTGALTVVGGVGIAGQISFDGLMRTKGSLYFGDGAEAFEAAADLTNSRAVFIVNGGPYAQIAIQNPAPNASGDILVYSDNGDDLSGWIDMGITGSAFNQPSFGITGPNDGYIFFEAPDGTSGKGNLVIATGNNGTENKIILAAGGFGTGNDQISITPNQNVHIEIATPSISPTTGALTIVGGVGISGDMNIAGDVNISGQISFAGGGTTVETENLAVTDPMIFVANGQLIGDNVDFAFLGQARSQRQGVVIGPRTTTYKSLTNNVATLVTGTVNHQFEIGDTVTVTGVDTLTTYSTFFPMVKKREPITITTPYTKNIVLVSRDASNVATITIDGTHDYLVGESVVVDGADTGYNGTFTITAVTANTLSFANTGTPDFSNVSPGTTTVSRTTNYDYVTITTTEPHDFVAGETVLVAGVASAYNGSFPILDVPTPTTFRYIQTGVAQAPNPATGSVQVARTVSATFDGTHTITAVPTSKSFSFAKTKPDVTATDTTKTIVNFVTSWNITNGVATVILTAPPVETIGEAVVIQDVDPLINDTLNVSAVSTVSPYSLSFEVPQDDVPATTLVTLTSRTVTSRQRQNNVSTLTLSTDHNYIIGQQIVVAGVSASFNGTFVITALPAANQVSYSQTATNINPTASAGTVTDSVPNPGTTTTIRGSQGTATVTDPYRGSYSGLARNHSTGEWSLVSGIESKPTSDIPWTSPTLVTNTLNVASLKATVDVSIGGGDLTASTSNFNLIDNTVTSLNFARAATAINMGANSGTLTIGNSTILGTQATQNLWNSTATTVNAFGAATTITMGATTGTVAIQNPVVRGTQTTVDLWNTVSTTVNAFGAATTLNIAAPVTTFNLGNTATGAQTVNMFTASTGASTYNVATGNTAASTTKTVNIGTGGTSTSVTNVNIGSTTSGATGTTTIGGSAITSSALTTLSNTGNLIDAPQPASDTRVANKAYVDNRPTIISTSQTLSARSASSSGNYFVIPASGMTLTLPASPVLGDRIIVTDIAGTAGTTRPVIVRNGQLIQGRSEDLTMDVANASIELVYSNTTYGWRIM
jgi:hypothetical protein